MISESMEYAKYFQSEQEIHIGIHLTDNKFFDGIATIRLIQDDSIYIELNREVPSGASIKSSAESVITSLGGWIHCRCSAVFEENQGKKNLKLRFKGPVTVRQQREYLRWDVYIPLLYSFPENQELVSIQEEWMNSMRCDTEGYIRPTLRPHENGYLVVGWNNGKEIPPQRVNLSGGGVRFLIREKVELGTLANLEIFLPLAQPKVISAVAMALRINELLLVRDNHTYYSTAMKFVCLTESDREDIISYLFVEQRNNLHARTESKR